MIRPTSTIDPAIESAVSRIVDQVIWHLSEEELDRDRVMEIIAESDGSDTAAFGLSVEQQLEAIEQGAEETGIDDLSFSLESLRCDLEAYAGMFVHMLAETRVTRMFEDLFDFMDDNDLDPEEMRDANPCGWMAHRSEREEASNCTVYEYRHVEERERHIDVWEYRMPSGETIWFVTEGNSED